MKFPSHGFALAAALAACCLLAAGSPAGAGEADAWSHLAAVRGRLAAASPLAVDFVQSYTPSGFSAADQESGVLSMKLVGGGSPSAGAEECVRWDYADPFPKGFLLCDRVAWTWNPGEGSGRRHLVARSDSFGLDLLRLSVEKLRTSYRAAVAAGEGDRIEIELVPTGGAAAAEIRDAAIELDAGGRRLLALSYHDVEGNLTRFTLGEVRSVADSEILFAPPAGLDWLDE